jgi:hypothetical protein
LGIEEEQPSPVKIGGNDHTAYITPPDSHFSDTNTLGSDFCNTHGVFVVYDYKNGQVKLFFDKGRKVVRDLKV